VILRGEAAVRAVSKRTGLNVLKCMLMSDRVYTTSYEGLGNLCISRQLAETVLENDQLETKTGYLSLGIIVVVKGLLFAYSMHIKDHVQLHLCPLSISFSTTLR
jgi:hypothetical protein